MFCFILLFMACEILNGVEFTVMREQIAVFVVGQAGSSDVNCGNILEGQKKPQRMSNMIRNFERRNLSREVRFVS
jgi:hypothetical protein